MVHCWCGKWFAEKKLLDLEGFMTSMLAGQQPIDHLLPPHLSQFPNFANQTPALEQEADPRKLCILGLPWDTTDETLRDYFSQYGPLEVSHTAKNNKTLNRNSCQRPIETLPCSKRSCQPQPKQHCQCLLHKRTQGELMKGWQAHAFDTPGHEIVLIEYQAFLGVPQWHGSR